jgi:hypothetical protein
MVVAAFLLFLLCPWWCCSLLLLLLVLLLHQAAAQHGLPTPKVVVDNMPRICPWGLGYWQVQDVTLHKLLHLLRCRHTSRAQDVHVSSCQC